MRARKVSREGSNSSAGSPSTELSTSTVRSIRFLMAVSRQTMAEITDVHMKIPTATSERADKRARPQIPWPEVQPEPMRVPSPVTSPLAMAAPVVNDVVEAKDEGCTLREEGGNRDQRL